MTLQRGGELSIVHALSGSSRGDAQPPHFSSLPLQRKSNATILVRNVPHRIIFYDRKYTSPPFLFLQMRNFVRFKKIHWRNRRNDLYIYIFNCIKLVCWTRKRKRLPALPSMAVIKDRQRGNFFQRLIARSRFEAHVFPEKGPRGGHSYRVVRRRFFGETLPSCRDGIIEN